MTKNNKTEEIKSMMERRNMSPESEVSNIIFESIKLGSTKLKDFLSLNLREIEKKPRYVIETQYKMAKLTHDLIRELNVQKRAEEGMKIRIYHLSAEDKPAFQDMITEGLPAYSPQ